MSEHGTITKSGATANPNGILPIYAYADRQHRQPFDIVPLLFEGANTIQIRNAIADAYNLIETTYGPIYFRVRRCLESLVKRGIAIKQKGIMYPGMLGNAPQNFYRLTLAATNLIRQVQISNPQEKAQIGSETKAKQPDKWYWARFPKRTNPLRIDACKLLRNTPCREKLWMWQRASRSAPLRPELQQIISCVKKPYDRYIREINSKAIVLCPYQQRQSPDKSSLKLLEYKTRFNSKSRQLANLDTYDNAWNESKKYYNHAVFLTLTTAPGMHENVWNANRHFAVAWNRYISLITKRNKAAAKKAGTYNPEKSYRPKYICVYEFQKNMMLHCHAILFGIDRIANDIQISRDWEQCGQGKITKQIPLVRTVDNNWEWARDKPADAKDGESPERYLRKYLNKAVYDHQDFEMYWAINKKFMSKSRCLAPSGHPDEPPKSPRREKQETEPIDYILDDDGVVKPVYSERTPEPPKTQRTPEWAYLGTIAGGVFPRWLETMFDARVRPVSISSGDPLSTPKNKHEPYYIGFVPASSIVTEENPPPQLITNLIPAEPDRSEYDRQLAEEARLMKERRARLKLRNG